MSTTNRRPRARDAYDAEAMRDEIAELCNDPEATAADLLAALVEHADQDGEISQAAREMGEDARGPRAWARDKREMRKLSRDARLQRARPARRFGRDDPEPFEGRPRPGGGQDPISGGRLFDPDRDYPQGEDRRRGLAGDMAYDSATPFGRFARRFPGAARIERA